MQQSLDQPLPISLLNDFLYCLRRAALKVVEGMGSATYFGVFTGLLKQQRDAFASTTRSRRPPRDRGVPAAQAGDASTLELFNCQTHPPQAKMRC
jgi:hypothetical protein